MTTKEIILLLIEHRPDVFEQKMSYIKDRVDKNISVTLTINKINQFVVWDSEYDLPISEFILSFIGEYQLILETYLNGFLRSIKINDFLS